MVGLNLHIKFRGVNMELIIKIDLDNDAFQQSNIPQLEIATILHKLGQAMTTHYRLPGAPTFPVLLRDSNGNTVGSFEIA